MKVRLAALALAVLPVGCATPQSRPLDLRPAWACSSRSGNSALEVTVVRTLDARGQQLDADVIWSIGGFDGGRLSLAAMQQIKGSGDPPAQPREILVSWSGFSDRVRRGPLLIVLHSPDRPPNALDGVAMIPYVNGRIGAVISWQGVRAMARNSPRAQLSLIDRRGHAIRSASLDLERLGAISGQMRAALDDTRAKAATFAKRCEPVADWRRL